MTKKLYVLLAVLALIVAVLAAACNGGTSAQGQSKSVATPTKTASSTATKVAPATTATSVVTKTATTAPATQVAQAQKQPVCQIGNVMYFNEADCQKASNAGSSSASTSSSTASSGNPSGTVVPQQGVDNTPIKADRTCGPSPKPANYWGPAGEAPQCLKDAASVLQADPTYLGIVNPRPGDNTATGWTLATSGTEQQGIILQAGHVPAGTCVDYDPGASTLTGKVEHTQLFNPKWRRTLLAEDGSFQGLKMTVYWTYCNFSDGYQSPVNNSAQKSTPSSKSSTSEPTKFQPWSDPGLAAARAANSSLAQQSSWLSVSDGGYQYTAGTQVSLTVPNGYAVVDPSGTHRSGEVKDTVFTIYREKS